MQTSDAKKTLLKLFSGNRVFDRIRAALPTNSSLGTSEIEVEDRLIDPLEYVMTKEYRMAQLEAEVKRAQAHRIPRVHAR
jgi:hypothetical protein